jgi:hypothetical protein
MKILKKLTLQTCTYYFIAIYLFLQIFDVQNSNEEKWTLYELDDLIYGFVKYSSEYVIKDCIEGVIEFVNRNIFDDN